MTSLPPFFMLVTILLLTTILFASETSHAQTSKAASAVEMLRKARPTISWNAKSAKVADVDCDSKPDTVVLGSENGNVVVGVVWGASKQPQISVFPLRRDTQDGFFEAPTKVEVSPLDCDSDELGPLPGCKVIKGCKAFSLSDDECDPFNFYWDSTHKKLEWWRQ